MEVERLTEKYWKNLDPGEMCGQDHFCTRGCHDLGGCKGGCIVPKLYHRLAVYEDTGLTPEKITAMIAPNAPLILEELREMGGEPYWHVGLQEDSLPPHWNILDPIHAMHIEDYGYGKRWLAYRRKPEMEWISVKDRLPDVDKTESKFESVTVIAFVPKDRVRPMLYERAYVRGKTVRRWKWIWYRLYDGDEITHWMPLPEPPKENKTE